MSNFAYKRAKREREAKPLTFTIDDDEFTLAPKLGTKALEGFARAERGELSGAFDALRAMLIGVERNDKGEIVATDYDRFIALDLDDEELTEVMRQMAGVYDPSGKASGSSTSSNGTGASSTPTSSPTTDSTSPTPGSESERAPVGSST